jgi:hypothetical protein
MSVEATRMRQQDLAYKQYTEKNDLPKLSRKSVLFVSNLREKYAEYSQKGQIFLC